MVYFTVPSRIKHLFLSFGKLSVNLGIYLFGGTGKQTQNIINKEEYKHELHFAVRHYGDYLYVGNFHSGVVQSCGETNPTKNGAD
jgi:hypothetical protein